MTTAQIDTTYDQLVERNGELMEEKAALVEALSRAEEDGSELADLLCYVLRQFDRMEKC